MTLVQPNLAVTIHRAHTLGDIRGVDAMLNVSGMASAVSSIGVNSMEGVRDLHVRGGAVLQIRTGNVALSNSLEVSNSTLRLMEVGRSFVVNGMCRVLSGLSPSGQASTISGNSFGPSGLATFSCGSGLSVGADFTLVAFGAGSLGVVSGVASAPLTLASGSPTANYNSVFTAASVSLAGPLTLIGAVTVNRPITLQTVSGGINLHSLVLACGSMQSAANFNFVVTTSFTVVVALINSVQTSGTGSTQLPHINFSGAASFNVLTDGTGSVTVTGSASGPGALTFSGGRASIASVKTTSLSVMNGMFTTIQGGVEVSALLQAEYSVVAAVSGSSIVSSGDCAVSYGWVKTSG